MILDYSSKQQRIAGQPGAVSSWLLPLQDGRIGTKHDPLSYSELLFSILGHFPPHSSGPSFWLIAQRLGPPPERPTYQGRNFHVYQLFGNPIAISRPGHDAHHKFDDQNVLLLEKLWRSTAAKSDGSSRWGSTTGGWIEVTVFPWFFYVFVGAKMGKEDA